jgi:hypothetical protein
MKDMYDAIPQIQIASTNSLVSFQKGESKLESHFMTDDG